MALFDFLLGGRNKPTEQAPAGSTPPPEQDVDQDLELVEEDTVDEFLKSATWLTMASSNVEAMRYLWQEQILEVEFKTGGYYQFFGVPYDVARGYVETLSPGRYHWNVIRDRYPYVLLAGVSRKVPRNQIKPTVVRMRHDIP